MVVNAFYVTGTQMLALSWAERDSSAPSSRHNSLIWTHLFLTSSQALPLVEDPQVLIARIPSLTGRTQARGSSLFAFCDIHLIHGKLTCPCHAEQQTCCPVLLLPQASGLQNSSGKRQAAVSLLTPVSTNSKDIWTAVPKILTWDGPIDSCFSVTKQLEGTTSWHSLLSAPKLPHLALPSLMGENIYNTPSKMVSNKNLPSSLLLFRLGRCWVIVIEPVLLPFSELLGKGLEALFRMW